MYIYTWIFIGYKFLSRADFGLISDHFLEIYPFQNKNDHFKKNMPLHVFIFESWWICPGISALFPGISAFFPGISVQKNRHIFTQSRVRSAQKARNPKLTTIIKKWPFPAPSQEIRPKGRNLGNGHLFVSFRRSRYILYIGYKFLSRADFGLISDHFLEIYPFQNKNDHFKKKHATSCFHFWVMMNLPGYFRPFPGYFRLFPGNFRPKKSTHFYAK